MFGSASNPMFDGARLASRGITVVTVNHRLGRLGFLAHPELSAESGYGGSGNYGLMDQIAALRWVQRNIEAFGGDPGNVTLGGVSAGGDSAQKLRCSPPARGLFHRVIAHSGPGVTPAIDGPDAPDWEQVVVGSLLRSRPSSATRPVVGVVFVPHETIHAQSVTKLG